VTDLVAADIVTYIGADAAIRWLVVVDMADTYPAIDEALATETAAQLRRCTWPTDPATGDDLPDTDVPDLVEALKRRVQRNLAMRPLPLALVTDGGADQPVRLGGTDPEVRRLEAPFRRRVVG
jgi:hypothetical protein